MAGYPSAPSNGVGREPRKSGRSAAFSSTGIMSGPRRWPRIPSAHVDSPNSRTRSARTPGPATTNGTGSPEWITSGEAGVAWSPVTQTIARSMGNSPRAASILSNIARFRSGSFVCPAASALFWCANTNVSPASSRSRIDATRPRRSAVGSSVSFASTASSPTARARPRRNADSAMNVPRRPWRSSNVGTCRGRPHHFNVITLKRSPSSRRITSRVHSSAARAVRDASGTSGCGRNSG